MATLRNYQRQALEHLTGIYSAGSPRATLVLPCGTGKTIVAAHLIAEHHTENLSLTVMFVPTVDLLSQTINRMQTICTSHTFLAVCSAQALSDADLPTSTSEADTAAALGSRVTTDPDTVAARMQHHKRLVIVATYASSAVVAEALRGTQRTADLLICDEAHRTAGLSEKAWAQCLNNDLMPARNRLFMTATTKIVTAPETLSDDVDVHDLALASMDSITDYGHHVAPLSFRQAIADGYLSDYQIGVVAVSSTDVYRHMQRARAAGNPLDVDGAAAQIAVLNFASKHSYLRSILAFHNRISASRQWSRQLRQIVTNVGDFNLRPTDIIHVDGASDATHRTRARNVLHDSTSLGVVSNCKLFAEGVDVPALDAVLFAGPRTSSPEIVQIVGRAMRPHPGPDGRNRKALIILPVIDIDDDASPIDFKVARTSYLAAWQVLTTLAEEDEAVHLALTQWRSHLELPNQPQPPTDTVAIDTTLIPSAAAETFRLHLVRRTTSHYVLTAHKLAQFYARNGHANPPAANVTDMYPLGRRLREVRRSAKEGRLPPRIRTLFDESAPGWESPTKSRQRRLTNDDYIDRIEAFSEETNGIIRNLDKKQKYQSVDIGAFVHSLYRRNLDEQQIRRLATFVNIP